jgi:transposase, IS5 family
MIGHLKLDRRMFQCWLKGSESDTLNAVLRAAGYNLHWLLRVIVHLGFGPKAFCRLLTEF